jgi:hypothetical protein
MKILSYICVAYWALILGLFVFGYKPTDLTVALGLINSVLLFFFTAKETK